MLAFLGLRGGGASSCPARMADTGRLGPSKTKRDRKARSMGFLYIGGTSRSLRFTSRTAACIRCLFNEHRGFSHEGRATWREQAVCGYRRRRMFRVHPQAGHFSLYEGGVVKLRLGSCIVVSVG